MNLENAQKILARAMERAAAGASRLGMNLSTKPLAVQQNGSTLTFWTSTSKVEVSGLRTVILRRPT